MYLLSICVSILPFLDAHMTNCLQFYFGFLICFLEAEIIEFYQL